MRLILYKDATIIPTKKNRERGDDDLDESMTLAVINFQNGCHVATTITIIRCTKNGDHLLFLILPKKELSKLCRTAANQL